jgi:hypothetical protein
MDHHDVINLSFTPVAFVWNATLSLRSRQKNENLKINTIFKLHLTLLTFLNGRILVS